jgi:hypothetical protein
MMVIRTMTATTTAYAQTISGADSCPKLTPKPTPKPTPEPVRTTTTTMKTMTTAMTTVKKGDAIRTTKAKTTGKEDDGD